MNKAFKSLYKIRNKLVTNSELGNNIYIAQCKNTGKDYYLNSYCKSNPQYYNSYSNQLLLQHPKNKFIHKFHDKYEDSNNLYVLSPYYGKGTLYNKLSNMYFNNSLTEDNIKKIFLNIVNIVKLCHDKNITILNLSPDHLLLDNDNNLIFTDFSNMVFHDSYYYKELSYITNNNNFRSNNYNICMKFSAPEIFNNKYSKSSDIFTLSTILYILLTKKTPFDKDGKNLLYNIVENEHKLDIQNISTEGQNLLFNMCNINSIERLSIYELSNNPWLKI